jgi:hypothetical protein
VVERSLKLSSIKATKAVATVQFFLPSMKMTLDGTAGCCGMSSVESSERSWSLTVCVERTSNAAWKAFPKNVFFAVPFGGGGGGNGAFVVARGREKEGCNDAGVKQQAVAANKSKAVVRPRAKKNETIVRFATGCFGWLGRSKVFCTQKLFVRNRGRSFEGRTHPLFRSLVHDAFGLSTSMVVLETVVRVVHLECIHSCAS